MGQSIILLACVDNGVNFIPSLKVKYKNKLSIKMNTISRCIISEKI